MPATRSRPPKKSVALTHGDKVWFSQAKLTKEDVLDFYRRIAAFLLPHLKDRPLTLERLPEGVGEGKPHFWQKNAPAHYPSWIPRVSLPNEMGKEVRYVMANDQEALLYLVNQGTITFTFICLASATWKHPTTSFSTWTLANPH